MSYFNQGYGYDTMAGRDAVLEKTYKYLNNITSRVPGNAHQPIDDFLMLQKRAAGDTSVLNAPPKSAKYGGAAMDTPEAKQVMNMVNQAAGITYLKNFYDMYMNPMDKCDIFYRLGAVTSVKANKDANDKAVTTQQTDEYGRLVTTTNFYHTFNVNYLNAGAQATKSIPYVNLFFPPFTTTQSKTMSLEEYHKSTQYQLSKSAYRDVDSQENTLMFDFVDMVSTRGNFTYRRPAFKAVNDNINFLQWMFEQATGIVSTYLTEWDLSLYIQEGLISNTAGKLPAYISLVHRLNQDNPSGFTDYKANGYGLLNAAVSKLFKTNEEKWDPAAYPQSVFWTPYRDWEASKMDSTLFVDADGVRQRIPNFFLDSYYKTAPNGLGQWGDFYNQLVHWDYENASMAGWYNWTNMCCYQALYSTPDDGLSDVDIALLETATGFHKKIDVLKTMFNISFGMNLDSVGQSRPDPVEFEGEFDGADGDATDVDGESGEGSLKICGVKVSGGLLSKIKKVVGIFTGASSKKSSAQKACDNVKKPKDKNANANSGSGNGTGGGSGNGTGAGGNGGNGGDNGNEGTDLTDALGLDESSIDGANTTGVPQTNPVLYGGPHGHFHSPRSVQSYLEPSNGYMRNIGRLDPSILDKNYSSDNKSQFFEGNEKWFTKSTYYRNAPEDWEHSFSEGKKRQRDGIAVSRIEYARCEVIEKGYFIGLPSGRGRNCYRYPVFPDTYEGGWIHWAGASCPGGRPWRNGDYWRGDYSWWYTDVNMWNGRAAQTFGFGTSVMGAQSYGNYLNNTSRIVLYYWSGGQPYQRIGTCSPVRQGEYHVYKYTPYKRYLIHSEPTMKWKIVKTRYAGTQVWEHWASGLWGEWLHFWKWIYGINATAAMKYGQPKDIYRLRCPSSGRVAAHTREVNNERTGVTYPIFRTDNEQKVFDDMVDCGYYGYPGSPDGINEGVGNKTYIIFLVANSASQIQNNGPSYMFRAPVYHRRYTYLYDVGRGKKYSCNKYKSWWEKQSGTEDYLEVDLNNADMFYSQLDHNPNNNVRTISDYPWEDSKLTEACWARTVFDLIGGVPSEKFIAFENAWDGYLGIQGYGMLQTIQAFENHYTNPDNGIDYSSVLAYKGSDRYSAPLGQLGYKYFHRAVREIKSIDTSTPSWSVTSTGGWSIPSNTSFSKGYHGNNSDAFATVTLAKPLHCTISFNARAYCENYHDYLAAVAYDKDGKATTIISRLTGGQSQAVRVNVRDLAKIDFWFHHDCCVHWGGENVSISNFNLSVFEQKEIITKVDAFDEGHAMPVGLKKALARIYTRGTLYADYQFDRSDFSHYYNVDCTSSFRILYSQLLWQKSFTEHLKNLICGEIMGAEKVDFQALYYLMAGDGENKGTISERTFLLADPQLEVDLIDLGEDRKYHPHEIYGYNPWIAELRKNWVSANKSDNAAKKQALEKAFDNRIEVFAQAIQDSQGFVNKLPEETTVNEINEFISILKTVNSAILNNDKIEKFMMGYLNLLYENRRYFINKRCNKQDGSLFLARSLESAIPMVIATATAKEYPNTEDLGSGPKPIPVAFYTVQNKTSDKLGTIGTDVQLDMDRVDVCYVKMKMATEKAYLKSLEDFNSGNITEPKVVRVLPYHLVNKTTFDLALNNPKLKSTVLGPNGLLVFGGAYGDEGTKYCQYDYTYDSQGFAKYKYSYAYKPADGLYRLESKEFLDNLDNIQWNNSLKESGAKDYDKKAKIVNANIEEAFWNITWGEPYAPNGVIQNTSKTYKESGASEAYPSGTPGIFDLVEGIDVMKAADVFAAAGNTETEIDPIQLICAAKNGNNYWTVKVQGKMPKQVGFLNDVKLVPYKPDDEPEPQKPAEILGGVMAYSLYPIMAEPVEVLPDIKNTVMQAAQNMAGSTTNPNYAKV